MRYYAKVFENTIQIIPSMLTPIRSDLNTTENEIQKQVNELALNQDFYIPLKSLKLEKVPTSVDIFYGDIKYSSISELVVFIYKNRRYSVSEEQAKRTIMTSLLKGIIEKKKVYGKEIRIRFDYIDASNYEILY